MNVSSMNELVGSAEKACRSFSQRKHTQERGYMVLSDLCGSTELTSRDFQAGVALQAAHEIVSGVSPLIATNED